MKVHRPTVLAERWRSSARVVMPATSSVPAVAVSPVVPDTLNTFDPTTKSPTAVKMLEFTSTCAVVNMKSLADTVP